MFFNVKIRGDKQCQNLLSSAKLVCTIQISCGVDSQYITCYTRYMIKTCASCKQNKPQTDFYSYRTNKRQSYCHKCNAVRTKEWRINNLERARAHGRKHYWAHRSEHSEQWQEYRNSLKAKVYAAYSGSISMCACCGESEKEFLCIDHINGNGAEHRKLIAGKNRGVGGVKLYLWLIRNGFPTGFQILCNNCDTSKGSGSVCIHQRTMNGGHYAHLSSV